MDLKDLSIDLRNLPKEEVYANALLPEDANESLRLILDIPKFVQVMMIKRADLSKQNNACFRDDSSKFYELRLHDGIKNYAAVYLSDSKSSKIRLNIPAGTKLKLSGEVDIFERVLFLNEKNTTLLGGKIETLQEAWDEKRTRISKDLFA